jgi:ABC-2 type transport system permease protein
MLLNPAIAGLTLRQSLARRRWIVVGVLAALPVIMAVLTRLYASADQEPIGVLTEILSALMFTVVVPVVALTLASSGFGAEVDDGTVVYLITKPIPRAQIVVTKLLVTACICMAFTVVSALASGLIVLGGFDATRLLIGFVAGAALGSILYTAVFLALGLVTRRGMLVGLVYLVVWEGTLSRLFAGTRTLSIRQYMLSLTDAISTADATVFSALLPHQTAFYMSGVVAVGAVALCIHRLRTFEVGQSG